MKILTGMKSICCLFPTLLSAAISFAAASAEIPVVRISPERLPDMHVARASHAVFYANGELTVTGGHTSGFVPTQTAEHFSGGQWHQLTMAYTHDNGLFVPLRSGRVLICGGHSEALGIGQTFLAEWYDAATHTFTGFGCLDRRRALAQGVETDSGQVLIAGNHYREDGMELFDGKKHFTHLKDVSAERLMPCLLRMSDGDVCIVGSYDTRYRLNRGSMADRMRGEPFSVPLLEEWRPLFFDHPYDSQTGFIGDEAKGDFTYLLAVSRRAAGKQPGGEGPQGSAGQCAIAVVRDTVFSLLPTSAPLPMTVGGDSLFYESPVVADRFAHHAYIVARTLHDDLFCLQIDYSRKPATLTLLDAGHAPGVGNTVPVMTPSGDLLIAGGINHSHDNFDPIAAVWLLPVGYRPAETAPSGSRSSLLGPDWAAWLWLLIIILLCAAIAYTAARHLGNRRAPRHSAPAPDAPEETPEQLFDRLCRYMEEEQPFLQPRLRTADVASALGVPSTAVTECLTTARDITFAQLLAELRVRHAQQLLNSQPEEKLSSVYTEAGFTSESTFFRTFKAVTGLSPKEWLMSQDEGKED